jgi:hypothetical protein
MWGPQPTRARLVLLARPGELCPPGAPPSDVICTKNCQIFKKNRIKFSGHYENFHFWVIFLLHEKIRKQTKHEFYFY